jgi:voltage-gated potassium channel
MQASSTPSVPSAPSAPSGLFGWLHHWLFDHDNPQGFAAQIERFVAFLIVLSVCAVVLEHVPEVYEPNAHNFHWFDVITVGIFTLEYALRWLTAGANPEFAGRAWPRLRYTFSFYALVDLVAIAPFYFAQFVAVDVEMLRVLRLLRLMRMLKFSRQLVPAWQEFQEMNKHRSLRAKVYALLEPTGHSGLLHYYVDNFIVFWIGLSIVCVVLESVDSIHHLFAVQFHWVDVIAFSVFTVEYLARLYCAPENPEFKKLRMPRWGYVKNTQALIDLVTILPFVLEHFLPFQLDLRFLRVFRLMRMLKLTRYTSATDTLLKVVKREWQVVMASVFVMMLLVVLTASLGYLFEHDAQPDKFENIPQSIYWAVVTLASVGYGDISPITPMGRALTVVLALVGIGIFAIPAGLLASAFTDQLRIDRESFKRSIVRAFEDGELSPKEREEIIAEAERLHLTHEEYERLIGEAKLEFEEKTAAQQLQFGNLMLDAKAHPEFAAEQFRILVAQLNLLLQATGEHTLHRNLGKISGEDTLEFEVLKLIAQRQAR